MKKIIRIVSVILLIGFYAFLFQTSKSTGIREYYGKVISVNGNSALMEVQLTNRVVTFDDMNNITLVEGEWYQYSHKSVTWGYEPFLIEVESTYSLNSYYDPVAKRNSPIPLENEGPVSEYRDDSFEILLYSKKDIYFTDEEIEIYGTITYIGEDELITISHGFPFMNFAVTTDEGFVRIPIELPVGLRSDLYKGEVHEFILTKGAGEMEDVEDSTVWAEFYDTQDMYYPEGKYEVVFLTSFDFPDETYDSRIEYSFNVIERK